MRPRPVTRLATSSRRGENTQGEGFSAIRNRHHATARIATIAGLLRISLELGTPAPAAAQAGVWMLTGEVTVTASALGRTVQRMQRSTVTLILAADGTYRAPGGIIACPTAAVVFPDEVGTWQVASRRRIFFTPLNLQDEIAALR